jgi:hypothetical protein
MSFGFVATNYIDKIYSYFLLRFSYKLLPSSSSSSPTSRITPLIPALLKALRVPVFLRRVWGWRDLNAWIHSLRRKRGLKRLWVEIERRRRRWRRRRRISHPRSKLRIEGGNLGEGRPWPVPVGWSWWWNRHAVLRERWWQGWYLSGELRWRDWKGS